MCIRHMHKPFFRQSFIYFFHVWRVVTPLEGWHLFSSGCMLSSAGAPSSSLPRPSLIVLYILWACVWGLPDWSWKTGAQFHRAGWIRTFPDLLFLSGFVFCLKVSMMEWSGCVPRWFFAAMQPIVELFLRTWAFTILFHVCCPAICACDKVAWRCHQSVCHEHLFCLFLQDVLHDFTEVLNFFFLFLFVFLFFIFCKFQALLGDWH